MSDFSEPVPIEPAPYEPAPIEPAGWESLRTCAASALNVWVDGCELAWAQRAWQLLVDRELAGVDEETGQIAESLDGAKARLRFIALIQIYYDWCYFFDEVLEDELPTWVDELNIHPFYLGQLVGPDTEISSEGGGEVDEYYLLENACLKLLLAGAVISRQRPPTAKGMTFLILEDETGRLPTAMTPPVYEKFRVQVRESGLLIEGKLESAGPGQQGNYRSVLIHCLWPLNAALGGYRSYPGETAR